MKFFFKTFIESCIIVTFIFNPIVLNAHEVAFQENCISMQGVNNSQEINNSTQNLHNKRYEKQRKKQSHKYRPKSYRTITGGILAIVGALGTLGALIIATCFLPFIFWSGEIALFVMMGCGGLLCIPLTMHVAGLQLLESE